MAQPFPVLFSPSHTAPSGQQTNHGGQTHSPSGGPSLAEPVMAPRDDAAAGSSSLAKFSEEGPPFRGPGNDLAPPTQIVGPLCLTPRWEPTSLPARVLNTTSEARALSTRHLYAIKWSVLSDLSAVLNEDPVSCDISMVLFFLEELLDKWCTPSTLKVYKPSSYGQPVYR